MKNPYALQPDRAFWRKAISGLHFSEITDLWTPIELTRADRVATAGSCFAQHLGHRLRSRGANYMDMEPAPPLFDSVDEARRYGYDQFSCRYGNVYTSRQLLQLFQEAFGTRKPDDIVWKRGDRFYDALRPGVMPIGHESEDDIYFARHSHLGRVKEMFETVDVFVFTLGLTEMWESCEDGTAFPTAPGTLAGAFDSEKYRFRNLRFTEIYNDMVQFREALLSVNPAARILLTVSPVSLAATATANHVLAANTCSKSVLRSVAGELEGEFENVTYFPSYEIITGHPFQGMFYNPDLRNVSSYGVDFVMKHFFSGALAAAFPSGGVFSDDNPYEPICDEDKVMQTI